MQLRNWLKGRAFGFRRVRLSRPGNGEPSAQPQEETVPLPRWSTVDALGETVIVEARTRSEARARLKVFWGKLPPGLQLERVNDGAATV